MGLAHYHYDELTLELSEVVIKRHWVHKTQHVDKQNTKTQHKTVNHNDEQNGRQQKPGVNLGARENTKKYIED